jgi:hypothetical protein
MTGPSTALASAWQAALAAEHRAVFGYALLGPRLGGAEQAIARTDSAAHAALRDATAQAIGAAGLVPVAPEADYSDLPAVATATGSRALALRLEEDCAAAWRVLYLRAAGARSATAESLRTTAQQCLTAAAVRGVGWRRLVAPTRPFTAFPGL